MPDHVLGALDKATEGFVSFDQLADRLGVAIAKDAATDACELEAIRAAALYQMRDGAFVGVYVGAAPEPWPSDITQVPAETLEVWAIYAETAEHPGVRARLHDLLASAGHGQRYQHVRASVMAYQEAAPWFAAAHAVVPGLWRAGECLVRGFTLAVSAGQKDLQNILVQDMLAMADESLSGPDPAAGLVGLLIDPLLERKAWKQVARPVVEKAITVFQDDVHTQVIFLKDLRALEADSTGKEQADRAVAEAIIRAADAESGVTRLYLLNDAAIHARDSGLTDVFDDVRSDLQKLTAEDLKLETLTTQVEFPLQPFDACEAHIAQAADLRDALWRVAAWDAPVGDDESATDTQQKLAAGLVRLPMNRLNLAGPVLTHLKAVEEEPGADLRIVRMELVGLLIAHQLDCIWRRFNPSDADLTRIFACSGEVAPPAKMAELATAFRSYWYQEPTAAKISLPLVEGLLRRHLRTAGVPIVQPAKGDKAGVVDQMGTLIDKMPEAGFEVGWQTTFRLLLADPKEGLNLRNVELHDLREGPPKHHHVALVLLAALVILRAVHNQSQ
ncbi:hypothetical protein [Streptomyces sp. NPDC059080]|uniref:hypothetical protein n=1 Tax=Streptomyces sp. NPDC059080 TaxID=3346718 RepID=UPI0036CF0374